MVVLSLDWLTEFL
uniref:Uncharacterized protein n=1 Tax=Rhizophora mucronata TaxID=61149 RepID=A0A2P2NBY0_RHIMU